MANLITSVAYPNDDLLRRMKNSVFKIQTDWNVK